MGWTRIGIFSACAAFLLLLVLHFIPHGKDLNPVDHWLSEYVLSDSLPARILMRLAFLMLALAALSVAVLVNGGLVRWLFLLSTLGLALMPFADTYANNGYRYDLNWPYEAGEWHQIGLYAAIGAALLGIALHVFRSRNSTSSEAALLGAAVSATIVQIFVVAVGTSKLVYASAGSLPGPIVTFGGVTERVIVVTMLAWVISFCLRRAEVPGEERHGIS